MDGETRIDGDIRVDLVATNKELVQELRILRDRLADRDAKIAILQNQIAEIKPTEMSLCEIDNIFLHADQVYVFRKHDGCDYCESYARGAGRST